jgi:hypothetical protein
MHKVQLCIVVEFCQECIVLMHEVLCECGRLTAVLLFVHGMSCRAGGHHARIVIQVLFECLLVAGEQVAHEAEVAQ